MKTFHLKHIHLVLISAILFITQSCKPPIPGSWKNERISEGQRNDFHKLNAEVLKNLKNNDVKAFKMLFSKDMNNRRNDRPVELLSIQLKDSSYALQDEYYVVHKYKDTDTVAISGHDINRYGLIYPYEAQQMYFAFFLPKKSDNKFMITLAYAKFDYGWKIVAMTNSPYSINGKTGPELYKLGREQYDKKQYQAALNSLSLAVTLMKPSEYIQYPDAGDAANLYKTVTDEVNAKYHYPIVLRQLATGPMILRVYTKTTDEGTFPLIYYMTHFELKDTTEVKKENIQIRAVVDKLMPGLSDGNKYIYYSAFNKQPTGYVTVDHFDMTVKGR